MSEKYTPDEAELIGCYAGAMEEQAGENYATAKADAERGIAKLKADALREAAGSPDIKDNLVWVEWWLSDRADRVEEEA